MKLSYKLSIAPIISIAVIIFLVNFTVQKNDETEKNITALVDKNIQSLSTIVALEEKLNEIKSVPPSLIVMTMMGESDIVEKDAKKAEKNLTKFITSINAISELQSPTLTTILSTLQITYGEILQFCRDGDSYSSAEKFAALNTSINALTDIITTYSKTVTKDAITRGEESKKSIASSKKNTQIVGYSAMGAVVVINLIITLLLIRALSKIFRFLKEYLGKNDFTGTLKINRNDEIGDFARWINSFSSHLREMIRKLRERSIHLEEESVKLKDVSNENSEIVNIISRENTSVENSSVTLTQSLSTITTDSSEITDFINATAAATEELSSSITEMNTHSTTANTLSKELQVNISDFSKQLGSLESAYNKISEVIEQVTHIAKQTKLLSINANVEAVRAGTAGKSFSVVAREVSDLADSSTKASNEITKEIQKIQEATESTMTNFGETKKMTDEIIEQIQKISIMISEQQFTAQQISDNNVESTGRLDHISSQVSQSSDNSSMIATSIQSMDKNILHVHNSTDHVKESAEILYEISSELEKLVEQFTV